MAKRKSNPDFLNGVPELLILKLLSREPMYGYQLVQAIREATSDEFQFGEGCIYPILHRLESEKLLVAKRETVAGRSRVIYRTTPQGTKRLAESVGAWDRVVQAVGCVLNGDEHGKPAMA
jgi:PadR family transcriptional regulator PadR